MALTKLGKLIELSELRNTNDTLTLKDVRGISIQKCFIDTKANMSAVSLKPYYCVPHSYFAYVTVTSRNGEKITIAYNTSDKTYLVSSSYVVFRVKDDADLLPDFLFIYFNRPEFDRYTRFNSWGSARETFSWDDMCDITIDLPPLPIQQKYVDVYNAMLANQQAYELGLEDLKLTCDAYIERLRHELPSIAIREYIEPCDQRNDALRYGLNSVRGVSLEKRFIETKANMSGVSLKPYKLIEPDAFSFVTVTSRNGEKISIAQNNSDETFICSSSYEVFRVCRKKKLLPSYLMMFFSRTEFDRYTRFHSWGSARETFTWDDLCDIKIPIPDIKIQQYIVNIYTVYQLRREINEQLKSQIKDVCPILIKGSLEEATRI